MEMCLKINLCNNVAKANISRQSVTQSGYRRRRRGEGSVPRGGGCGPGQTRVELSWPDGGLSSGPALPRLLSATSLGLFVC